MEVTDPNGVTGSVTAGDDEGTTQSAEVGVNTAEYHERRGSSFFDNRRYVEAEKSYREAIRLDPSYARYFHNFGTALFAQN